MNIWVNGCFDILHTGHIDLLWFAKLYNTDRDCAIPPEKQNTLIVGLDTDERVKRLKGDKRPINDINTRVTMMENLKMVDRVVVFDSDDELRNAVKFFEIDHLIVGDHYRDKEVIGGENAKRGVVFYKTDERSTTNVIEKIMNIDKIDSINVVGFQINYHNEIIKMNAFPYDIMTNMMMFGQYAMNPRFEELELLEYVKSRFNSGGIALDIGANIGNHSIFFSKFIFDRTFAFEASSVNFTLLSKNKEQNKINDYKLIINNVALSDGNHKYRCQECEGDMGRSIVIEGDGEITTKRLDEFDFPKVDFIKIDVEGYELKVLKGAVKLIKRDLPDIIVECNMVGESTFEKIDLYMKKLGYRLIESFYRRMYYYKHIKK